MKNNYSSTKLVILTHLQLIMLLIIIFTLSLTPFTAFDPHHKG